MGRGKNRYKNISRASVGILDRTAYFDKYIRYQKTSEGYLMALRTSPFKTHRNAAQVLQGELKQLKEQHASILKENHDTARENTVCGPDSPSDTGSDVC